MTSAELVKFLTSDGRIVTFRDSPKPTTLPNANVELQVRPDNNPTAHTIRFRIPCPRVNPVATDPNGLSYWDDYLALLNGIQDTKSDSKAQRQRKFLMGLTLLTRCR
jgi:hypothetical protein